MTREDSGEVREALEKINEQSKSLLADLDAIKERSASILEDMRAIEKGVSKTDDSLIPHAELVANLIGAVKETETNFIAHLDAVMEKED